MQSGGQEKRIGLQHEFCPNCYCAANLYVLLQGSAEVARLLVSVLPMRYFVHLCWPVDCLCLWIPLSMCMYMTCICAGTSVNASTCSCHGHSGALVQFEHLVAILHSFYNGPFGLVQFVHQVGLERCWVHHMAGLQTFF